MLSNNQRLLKLEELRNLKKDYSLFTYSPYEKQIEFHNYGSKYRQRCLLAGNQLGKTYAAGCETAMHLTGLYPAWWEGRKFTKAPRGWVGSETAEVTRDGAQRILLGPINAIGTGVIPKDRILEIKKARGVPDAIESVMVKHSSGDNSLLVFKSYKDGREAWQAETLDFIWLDEEPPEDIYSEGLTRTNNTRGIVYLTFTPLKGMTFVVLRFWNGEPGTVMVKMTIDDAEHYTPEEREEIIRAYLPHEREARSKGIPMFGSGKVFTSEEAFIMEPTLAEIPEHWRQIIGIDFGWGHPTAAVRIAIDDENDCEHIISAYRQSNAIPIIHAAAIKRWGAWIPVAWPRDGLQTEKGSGLQLAHIYREQGLNILSEFAQFPDKRGVSVEAGLLEMQQRFDTGGMKVDLSLREWMDEYRMYHRINGVVSKSNDDLMDATRYAHVMKRYAISKASVDSREDRWSKNRGYGGRSWMAV